MPLVDQLADFFRYGVFAFSGVGVGFMLITNWVAFRVLRPPKQLGFLWWHVTSISLSILCMGAVAMDNIVTRIGEPFTWRAPTMFVGTMLFAVAQVLIFKIERGRLVEKRALEILASQGS